MAFDHSMSADPAGRNGSQLTEPRFDPTGITETATPDQGTTVAAGTRRHRRRPATALSVPHAREPLGESMPDGRRALLVGTGPTCRAVAESLALAGWVLAAQHHSDPDAAREMLDDLPGTGHAAVAADLSDPAAVTDLFAALDRTLGGVDLVIDVGGFRAPAVTVTSAPDDWADALSSGLSSDLLATANLAHGAARSILARAQGGRIVIVCGPGGDTVADVLASGRQALAGGLARQLRDQRISVVALFDGVPAGQSEADVAARIAGSVTWLATSGAGVSGSVRLD